MSLLMNEDFTIYQLRAGYLQNTKDGVGERLITLNTSVLNNPAFRFAGWNANPSDIKRTYSPPIPTAIASEYFQAPPRSAGLGTAFGDEEEEGGMVTGQGSQDTIGITNHNKRRRRKEQLEEDDSSDLSDDSDEEDESKRAAQQIKFNKMPVRNRAGSSPQKSSQPEEVSLVITSPSGPPDGQGIRRGSLNAVDFYKQRPRRDTTTSSEFSSENDFDASAFRRQKVHTRSVKNTPMFADRIQEEESENGDSDLEDEDVGEASDLSDEFDGAVDSASLLGLGPPIATVDTLDDNPLKKDLPKMPPAITAQSSTSPKRQRHLQQPPPSDLPRLPTGRPISYVQPVSLLSKALKGSATKDEDPFRQFAQLSGKGESNPLWIKIHAPFSTSSKPFEVPLRRTTNDGAPVTVAELMGLSLWRYAEEKREPPIKDTDMNVNRWTLRMVEDDEVDFDFPALGRTRPVADFTSNNNRPVRGRARDKPWDEFALVRANDEQFKENEELTPQFSEQTSAPPPTNTANTLLTVTPVPDSSRSATPQPAPMLRTNSDAPTGPSYIPNANPITSSFAPMARKNSSIPLLDAPAAQAPRSTPRNGVATTVTIHFTDPQSFQTTLLPIPTTSDTYLAELFTMGCQRLNLDKALYVLKVRGTQTVAPQDRTVEALGSRTSLDLVRRRFVGVGDGWGTHSGAGSPGSDSPNAPLLLTTGTTPKQKSRKAFMGLQTSKSTADMNAAAIYGLGNSAGKRYLVIRRQPLSFAPSHPRILALDAEFMHIMPASSADALNANIDAGMAPPVGKTTSVHFSAVVGCKVSRKHPKVVRVLVYREKETKRYDFEAGNRDEASEISGVINRGMLRFRDTED
ncbi:stress-activated map kinase-interacting protein-like protein [Delphinella strobiligena]|nr:stress-activated map kinase-interacting protein-like protein [Delphinella strobiligena]